MNKTLLARTTLYGTALLFLVTSSMVIELDTENQELIKRNSELSLNLTYQISKFLALEKEYMGLYEKYISLQYSYEYMQELNTQFRTEKCSLYDGIQYRNMSIANGLYWPTTDYYCVWAKGRTLEEQEKTDRHEYCHYLIDNDYKHFCFS
jgi:hypothetical protein